MPRTTAHAALLAAGLTANEAAVWSALADHGSLNVSEIGRHAALHRPGVYAALKSLARKKLVALVKGAGRAKYDAVGADTLGKLRAANDAALGARLENVAQKSQAAAMPEEVEVFRGKDLRKIWEQLAALPRGSTFYRYDGYAPGTDVGKYVPETYRTAIGNRSLERFVITNKGLRGALYKKRIECASKMMPGSFDAFEQGVSVFVYGDKVATVDFGTQTAFVIRNAAAAAYQIKLFQYLYETLAE